MLSTCSFALINRLFIKETGNILNSSSSVSHINFIDQDANWIRRSGSLKPDIFYSGKLHLVEKGKFFKAKSIYISMNSHDGLRKNYQLSKKYKSMTAFSLNKADFPTLTPLSPRKPVADCISVSLYKSVHNSFITSVQKPYISSIKTVLRKCSIYDSSLGDTNKCVHVSVNHTICKASVTLFVNVLLIIAVKCSKFFLSSHSVSAVFDSFCSTC